MAGAVVVAEGFCTSSGFMMANGVKKILPTALRLSRSTRKHESSDQLVIRGHKALSAPLRTTCSQKQRAEQSFYSIPGVLRKAGPY